MSEDEIRLDWAAAEVHDGQLSVPLAGETPKKFKAAFEHAERLLAINHPEWGEVRLKKDAVRVADVPAGAEDTLRFHLEGVVQQAVADVTAPAEGGGGEEPEGPDGEMTARFRAFAESESESAESAR